MKIVAARNMPFVEAAFSTLGEVTLLEGRQIGPADVRDADLLVTRSTTQINRALLENSRVRFYGTATIGTDHMDTAWLDSRGIRWCSAAGCNANSVSEYVTAALLELGARHGLSLAGKTLGIIGVGNVGRRVAGKAAALGMQVALNDPPRARGEVSGFRCQVSGEEVWMPWETLPGVLEQADVVTLHVPLTADGPDPTHHLADDAFFARLKAGAVFINAARGAVVDTPALLRALESGRVSHAVIDCWEGEPDFSPALMEHCALGTPHIAGYSYDGKVNGTVMVYAEACRFLGVEPTWSPDALVPPAAVPEIEAQAGDDVQAVCRDVVKQVYSIEADDRPLREAAAMDASGRRDRFDALRRGYPVRREFPATRVSLTPGHPAGKPLTGLGFRVFSSPHLPSCSTPLESLHTHTKVEPSLGRGARRHV